MYSQLHARSRYIQINKVMLQVGCSYIKILTRVLFVDLLEELILKNTYAKNITTSTNTGMNLKKIGKNIEYTNHDNDVSNSDGAEFLFFANCYS